MATYNDGIGTRCKHPPSGWMCPACNGARIATLEAQLAESEAEVIKLKAEAQAVDAAVVGLSEGFVQAFGADMSKESLDELTELIAASRGEGEG